MSFLLFRTARCVKVSAGGLLNGASILGYRGGLNTFITYGFFVLINVYLIFKIIITNISLFCEYAGYCGGTFNAVILAPTCRGG